ncbi:hypothetical protein ACIRN4_12455 [Pimelobacter simplex]|uniref:hypothetical protein n=1 Tax=Nocardioides simplex TaxID=2045 RepID=UPI00380765AB
MSKPSLRTVLMGTVAAVGLTAGTLASTVGVAQATDPLKVGGGPKANFVLSSANVKFVVSPSLTELTCTTFSLAGNVNAGTINHTAAAGTLGTLTSSGCWQPQLGAASVTPVGTWTVKVTGDAPSGSTVWPAKLDNVSAHVSADVADCSVDANGTVTGTFNTATQKFTATGSTLALDNVTGADCATLDILDGDPVSVTGTWTNTPPAGSSAITLGH